MPGFVVLETKVFGDIQDLFLEALGDASNNFQKAEKNTAKYNGVKYQVREDFAQRKDSGRGKDRGRFSVVGKSN